MGRSVKRSDLQTGWHSSSRHPFYCDSGLVRWRTFLRRRAAAVFLFVEFLLNLQFPLLIRISASSAIGNGKLVVASGIGWHHLHIALQWRDRVLRAHGGNKCHSQSEIGFGKAWVQLVSFCEMWNGIVPLTVAACKLPKPEFRGSVQRIDGELKFELLLCILGVLRRIGALRPHVQACNAPQAPGDCPRGSSCKSIRRDPNCPGIQTTLLPARALDRMWGPLPQAPGKCAWPFRKGNAS